MKNALLRLEKISGATRVKEKITDIVLDICKSRIDAANAIGKQIQNAEEKYEEGSKLIKQGKYESGFDSIQKAFTECDMLIKGQIPQDLKDDEIAKQERADIVFYFFVGLFVIGIIFLLFVWSNQKH